MERYEEELFDEYMKREGDLSIKSYWIRETLERVEASPYDLWKWFKEFSEEAHERGAGWKTGTYSGMRRHIWILKRLGLVEKVREEESKRGGKPRNMYTLVRYDSESWDNPQKALYG